MKAMKKLLFECDISTVISILAGGKPKASFMGLSVVYYSFYRYLIEAWTPDDAHKTVISSYKKVAECTAPYTYAFYEEDGTFPIDFLDDFNNHVEVVVPDCFVEATSTEHIVAAFLYQFKSFWDAVAPEYNKYYISDKLWEEIYDKYKSTKVSYSAYEKILCKLLSTIDNRIVQNEITVLHEEEGLIFSWEDMFTSDDVAIMELEKRCMSDDLRLDRIRKAKDLTSEIPVEYAYYIEMDVNNPPSVLRGIRRKRRLRRLYSEVGLEEYKDVINSGYRIVVENNALDRMYPHIYVCDKFGKKTPINKVEPKKLVCMDIFVTDEFILFPEEVLGKMMFYLEYPIRTERIQREKLGWALSGMFKLSEFGVSAS